MKRRIIGLTGGIATGKSTVSSYLSSQYGLPVLDADIYARKAVEKGGRILDAIAHRYGQKMLLPDGSLDRKQLGSIIFQNAAEKQWVEAQIHPFVRAQFAKVAKTYSPDQVLVYSIPLLFEANLTHLVTEVWVVYCQPAQQKQRLTQRNQLLETEAVARINSQMDLRQKCERADYVLDNSTTKESLFARIDRIMGDNTHQNETYQNEV
ncbi:dephospho-CoA kinase [Synechococcus sp. PCC 7335]|nr:dephospho-CoA kinase [Synechococcus sp. PCC 7335]